MIVLTLVSSIRAFFQRDIDILVTSGILSSSRIVVLLLHCGAAALADPASGKGNFSRSGPLTPADLGNHVFCILSSLLTGSEHTLYIIDRLLEIGSHARPPNYFIF